MNVLISNRQLFADKMITYNQVLKCIIFLLGAIATTIVTDFESSQGILFQSLVVIGIFTSVIFFLSLHYEYRSLRFKKVMAFIDLFLINIFISFAIREHGSVDLLWPAILIITGFITFNAKYALSMLGFSVIQLWFFPMILSFHFSPDFVSLLSKWDDPMLLLVIAVNLFLLISYINKLEKQINISNKQNESLGHLAEFGEMASEICHELMNPLSIISGANSFLQMSVSKDILSKESLLESLAKVERAVSRTEKMIGGIKNLYKFDSHNNFELVTLNSIIEDGLGLLENKCNQQGIQLEIKPYCEEKLIYCNSVQMSQVLIVLVNNAISAIENLRDKWIQIEVIDDPAWLEISVMDSGPGISKEIVSKIFEPFYTTKELGKGSGLGLSIAHKIITAHQGQFGIDQKCSNTKFYIRIPHTGEQKLGRST